MEYDVIVVGASFAGLAVAARLAGKRVLLIDHKPIGTGQTSACGTLVSTLTALGLQDAIQQVHDRLIVHTPGRTIVYPVPEPYCTFDYATFCNRLRVQGDAQFVHAAAVAVRDHEVQTTNGMVTGTLVVDASGWRSLPGSGVVTASPEHDRRNFGLETTVPYHADGLQFWYAPRGMNRAEISWVFPAGDTARVGIGSYRGHSQVGDDLDRFLDQFALAKHTLHGGFFPHALREPVVGDRFLVGDAAGHCLGLTGEGIRPALFFGTHLGFLLRGALDEAWDLAEAKQRYRALVAARKGGYDLLCLTQRLAPRLPLFLIEGLLALGTWPRVRDCWISRYVQAFSFAAAPVPGLAAAAVPRTHA